MIRIADIAGRLAHDQIMQNRVIRGVEIVLVLLIAYSLARLIADLIPPVTVGNSPPDLISLVENKNNPLAAGNRTQLSSVTPALGQLFGNTSTTAVNTQVTEQPLQRTPLNLVLKGILADQGSQNRLALISASGQKEKVYRTGDSVEGAEIIRIEPRRVVIRRNGITESVDLEARKLTADAQKPPTSLRFNVSSEILKVSETERVMTRSTLEQYRNNLPALLLQASAVPHIEDGEQIGFRVTGMKQGSVFEQLGLRQDDVIYAVNGTPVRNAEDALNAYQNLASATRFRIGVLRGGQDLKLDISVQ